MEEQLEHSGSIPRHACRLRNIAICDYQESVTTGQTHGQTDAGQSDPYVPLCFAGDTKTDSQQGSFRGHISLTFYLLTLKSKGVFLSLSSESEVSSVS